MRRYYKRMKVNNKYVTVVITAYGKSIEYYNKNKRR